LWLSAKFAVVYLAHLPAMRDEAILLVLIAVGAIVYGGAIFLMFGKNWLRSLLRG
jgi:putative peptidoglycan lipid II flippase